MSAHPVLGFTFSIFLAQLITHHDWTQSAGTAWSVYLFCAALALPAWGALVDRTSARKCITASVVLFALTLGSFKWLSTEVHWYLGYAVLGFASGGISALPYLSVVSSWFDRRRGLALGIVMAGGGVSAIIMPIIAQLLIERVGWQNAFPAIAGIVLLVTLPVIWLLLVETPAAAGVDIDDWGERSPTSGKDEASDDGDTKAVSGAAQALRSRDFWLMVLGMATAMLVLNGTVAHLVPILQGWGFSARNAALTMSLLGAGSLSGRVLTGWLLDRLFASHVAALIFIVGGLGLVCIPFAVQQPWAVALCAFVLGLAIGGENDIMGYMISRYFAIASFGQIYGYAYMGFVLGAAAGPAFVSAMTVYGQSPDNVLLLLGFLLMLASIPILKMSDYRSAPVPPRPGVYSNP